MDVATSSGGRPTESGYSVTSSNKRKDLGQKLPNLSEEDVVKLHSYGIVIGSVTIAGYAAGGPEVGAFVNTAMSVPAMAVSLVTTADTWGDYFRLENPQNGDLIRAWSNTAITITSLIYWQAAVPAAILQIMDQEGKFDNLWRRLND